MSTSQSEEFNTLAAHQQTETLKGLAANRNKVFAIGYFNVVHNKADALVAETQRRVKFDCKSGCVHCCSMRVEVFAPEIFLIARHLKKLPAEKLREVTERLQARTAISKDMLLSDFNLPCALLEDNKCSVYEVRPHACRKYNSQDVEACKDRNLEVPQDPALFMKSAALITGAARAYRQRKLSASLHELGQGVLLALTDPTAEERWFKGEAVFAPLPEHEPGPED